VFVDLSFSFLSFLFSGSYRDHFPHSSCVWQTDAEIESVPSESQQKQEVYDDRPLYEVDALFHLHLSVAVSLFELHATFAGLYRGF
jgi:hypothetical protein